MPSKAMGADLCTSGIRQLHLDSMDRVGGGG